MSTGDVRFEISRSASPKDDVGEARVHAQQSAKDERESFAAALEKSRHADQEQMKRSDEARARAKEDDEADATVKDKERAPKDERDEVKGREEPAPREAAPARRGPKRAAKGAAAPKDLDTLVDGALRDEAAGARIEGEEPKGNGGGRQRERGLGPLDACLSFAPAVAVPVPQRVIDASLSMALDAPVQATAVDAGAQLAAALPEVGPRLASSPAKVADGDAARDGDRDLDLAFPSLARAPEAQGEAVEDAVFPGMKPAAKAEPAAPKAAASDAPKGRAEAAEESPAIAGAPRAGEAPRAIEGARPRATEAPGAAPPPIEPGARRPATVDDLDLRAGARAAAAAMEQAPLGPGLGAAAAPDPLFAEAIVEEGSADEPRAPETPEAPRAPEIGRREAAVDGARDRGHAKAAGALEPAIDFERHATAVAVSRLTRERAAHAEVDIPELGRIAVSAQRHAREIDVAVLAPAASVGVLREAKDDLSASLQRAQIPLGSLHVGVSDHGARGDGRPSEGAPWSGGAPQGSGDQAAIAARSTIAKRVRFVL